MSELGQITDFIWDRMWFANQSIPLEGDSWLLEKLEIREAAQRALDAEVEDQEPVDELGDLHKFSDGLRLAAKLHRAGRKDEAREYIEASAKAVRLYERKGPDINLAAALFFRARTLVMIGDVEGAVQAARFAVAEVGRLHAESPSEGRYGVAAYMDCLYGYVLSRAVGSKPSNVGGGKASIAYLVRGIIQLEGEVKSDRSQEPKLLWALELLAEAFAHEHEEEAAYFVRLELHRRWSADALRVQGLFDVALAYSLQRRADLASLLGLHAEERELRNSADQMLRKAKGNDVAAQEVVEPNIRKLLQGHFMQSLESVIGELDATVR